MPPGSAKVRWSKREDIKTEYTENLRLVDRVFLLGDIVARASDQIGQTGIVVGMRMFCDIRRADGHVLKRVPTDLLQPLTSCRPGALVVHMLSHWLGRVDEVYDNVQITFDDGASCKVLRTGANTLSVHSTTMDEQTWFWPGMRVSASRDVLRRAKWSKGAFRSSYVGKEATVVRVQAAQAVVRWLAAAPVDSTDAEHVSIEPPPDMQRPSRLLELTQHHSRLCWRLLEHATLAPADAERLLIERGMGRDEASSTAMTKRGKNGKKRATQCDTCVEVIACHTRVDVVWQDGTRDEDGAATAYAPAKHVDGYYEFWPQDYVVGKAVEKDEPPPVGVVESVNHAQRLCVITWRGGPEREVVPVYEIAPHPDFGFKVGDIVLRLPKAGKEGSDDATGPASALAPAPAPTPTPAPAAAAPLPDGGDDADPGDDDDDGASDGGGDMSHSRGRSSLSMIGEVKTVGPKLEVRWMDGTSGMVEPEEAYVVNVEEEDEPPPEEEDGSYDDEGPEAVYFDDDDMPSHGVRGSGPRGSGRRASHEAEEADGSDGSSGWETVDDDDDDGAEGDKGDDGDDDGVDHKDAAEKAGAKRSKEDSKKKKKAEAAASGSSPSSSSAAGKPADVSDPPPKTAGPTAVPPPPDVTAAEPSLEEVAEGIVDALARALPHAASLAKDKDEEAEDDAYGTAEELDDDGSGTPASPSEAEQSAARAVKAAKIALANGQSGQGAGSCLPLGSDEQTEADRAAIEAYAEHEQFWVDESEESWSWHHYYAPSSSAASSSSSDVKAPAPSAPVGPSAKVAQKQWRLLKAGLPAGIFVVACPARVDLLRAMIVGPPGTPYQDAVFLFDLQLPPEFPQQPPSVHYLSHGQRINPNLYENGKVCLSLLGTWTGRLSCELWNPAESNVLQVLISIQGLVLCEMPYFNEAGYDKQLGTAEGAHHARRYNEGAMLLSLKAMITSLAHPKSAGPVERLMRLHFASARRRILARCRKLLELKDDPEKAAAAERLAAAEQAAVAANEAQAGSSALGSGGAGASAGKGAVSEGPVAEAELGGVLNVMPSLGFLHSLARQMGGLSKALEAASEDQE